MAAVRVTVATLGIEERTKNPYMLLQDEDGVHALPIYIGLWEANAIAVALENTPLPRPISIDLLATTINKLGGRLDRVEVTRLEEGVYYALLFIEQSDQWIEIDCRPSDAVALALRLEAPIFVEEDVLVEGSMNDDERNRAERKKWKEFLEGLSDEDFGKYKT